MRAHLSPLLVSSALLCTVLSGCYLRHGGEAAPPPRPDAGARDAARRDAGPPPPSGRDAGRPPAPDAGPPRDGDYWALEPRESYLSIPHQSGCDVSEGGRVVLTVTVLIEDVCDHGAPATLERTDDGLVTVQGHVWRHHRRDPDLCPGITAISERFFVLEASAPMFQAINVEGTSRISVDVGDYDGGRCRVDGRVGASCVRDCDCGGGLVCVPEVGDFVACDGGRCGRPCDLQGDTLAPIYARHLECDASQRCARRGALAAPTCEAIAGDGCLEAPERCGPGTWCPPTGLVSECVWQLELNGTNRHPCRGDAECDDGLYCVEAADGSRRCDTPCFTASMACPVMHLCSGPSWVCEWLGE